MSIIGALSGENQIAKLTQGINQLPLEPLDEIHLQVILEILLAAWNNLTTYCHPQVFQEGEECVNRLMVSELNNMQTDSPSEWSQLVSSAHDANNIPNFDGTRIGKQPDISLTLTNNRHPNLPFIVECKLIEPSKSVNLYCKHGLKRFVDGEYSWYEKQAVMLAYVLDQSTIKDKLSTYLEKNQNKQDDPYQSIVTPKHINWLNDEDLAKTAHNRIFSYVGDHASSQPGVISIWHLWLHYQKK